MQDTKSRIRVGPRVSEIRGYDSCVSEIRGYEFPRGYEFLRRTSRLGDTRLQIPASRRYAATIFAATNSRCYDERRVKWATPFRMTKPKFGKNMTRIFMNSSRPVELAFLATALRSLFWLIGLFLLALVGQSPFTLLAQQPLPKEWSIPVAGNAYRMSGETRERGNRNKETISMKDGSTVYVIFFHVDRACELTLSLDARSKEGVAEHGVTVNGKEFTATIQGADFGSIEIGDIRIKEPGYVRLEVKGNDIAGQQSGEIKSLRISSKTEGLKVTYVASNEGNMFYWGRRGPSVHLSYTVPTDVDLEYAYSEIEVAPGDDPIGSYFMANGFREGYFGIQVNSDRERRILFSVWSPFQTDDPKSIPKDQRIELLARGADVKTGEFGNEGAGGQSYLIYPWKAGRTYRFLTQVKSDGEGSTIYTSWFGEKQADQWLLIASFRRPKTETYLKGFHSFLENFQPETGHISRRGQHQNIWVRDVQGNWHESLKARFSVDATGGGGHRLDFAGGSTGNKFFLRNCGFFSEPVKAGTVFTRDSSPDGQPTIPFDQLPRSE
jgi:hypothetical protein